MSEKKELEEMFDKLAQHVFDAIKIGSYVMWQVDKDGDYIDEWDIGEVVSKKTEAHGELMIEVKHPRMVGFNFKFYLRRNSVKIIKDYWPVENLTEELCE